MRQIVAVLAAAAVAALGAVVLGEYELDGFTAIVGFPLYGLAVVEVALAVARRLRPAALAATSLVVALGLAWALWISHGHLRAGDRPRPLALAMVLVAAAAAAAWGRTGRSRAEAAPPDVPQEDQP